MALDKTLTDSEEAPWLADTRSPEEEAFSLVIMKWPEEEAFWSADTRSPERNVFACIVVIAMKYGVQ